jgi:transposase
LPPQRPPAGRPNHDHRTIVAGILWVVRTGSPWRALPPRFGPWETVHSRYSRWRKAGIWQRILAALDQEADPLGT